MVKRIACVSALALFVGTLGFSADLKVKLQARVGSELFKYDLSNGTAKELMGIGDISSTDDIAFSYVGDNAGVYADIYLNTNTDSKATAPYIYDYYGWLKFGDLKITGGNWDYRYANRVTTDSSNFGQLWDNKYGVIKYGSGKEAGVTVDTESDHLNPWYETLVADYAIKDFMVSVSTGNTSSNSNYDIRDYFGARAAYNVKDFLKANATFIMNGKDTAQLGVFVEPLMVKNLTLVAGFSGKLDLADSANNVSAIELRGRYSIDKLAITSHNNITFADKDLRLYDMVNVVYQLSDMIKPCLLIANGNFSGDNTSTETNVTTLKLGATLTAQKNATIDAALRVDIENPSSGSSTTIVSMPVILRVKF